MIKYLDPPTDNIVEHTTGTGAAHLIILIMVFPLLVVYAGPFLLIWDAQLLKVGMEQFSRSFIPVILGGIVIHELLHGLGWAMFTKEGFRAIRFGFAWKFLSPYCHCREPLKAKHYRIGAALPLLVLGIVPAVTGLITGNGTFLVYGFIFTLGAGGDIISLYILRKFDRNAIVHDHPEKLGFYQKANEKSS